MLGVSSHQSLQDSTRGGFGIGSKVVEAIPGNQTSAETLQNAVEFISTLGKIPIRVKESPGFLVSRILGMYLMEATILVDEGRSTPKELDRALTAWGMQIGPSQLADFLGLDLILQLILIMGEVYGEKLSGSREASWPPRPLRTVHEAFTSHGSSTAGESLGLIHPSCG